MNAISGTENNINLDNISPSSPNVLVVDDVMTNLYALRALLKPYEVNVHFATSGSQAVDMIRSECPRYDAVFMDHMMPGMDGLEATRIIRNEIGTEYARNIPIIAFAGNSAPGSEDIYLNNGFQAILRKPVDSAILDTILRRWVTDKEPKRNTTVKTLPGGYTLDGVDIQRGVEHFGNDVETYMQVLHAFVIATRPLVNRLNTYLANGDLIDYEITIHGIKGSCYSIYAHETGKLAEDLETISKAGNLKTTRAAHIQFEQKIRLLLDLIDLTLSVIVTGHG
jgi:CheY-like chemotaxis protein